MTYFIVPEGTPSHNAPLEARLDSILTPPFMPTGHTIQWRYNGIPIKEGPTDDPFFLSINTNTPGDFKFDGTFTGAVVDFLIDEEGSYPPPASLAVVLSNTPPVLSGAGPVTDAYNRTSGTPTFVWTYFDADGDPQFFYRVRAGSTPLGTNYFDTGMVFSQASSVTVPGNQAIPTGTPYYWTIEVSDGQKVNPTDPDSPPPPRVTTMAQGIGYVNTPPVVSGILLDGAPSGLVPDLEPTISWTYSDIDGQPQQQFKVVVSSNSVVLWDSGLFPGNQSSIPYNYNLTGVPLIAPVNLTVTVTVYDTFASGSNSSSFTAYIKPAITSLTVQNKVNPQDIVTQTPFFNWTFTPADTGLSAYEIRVGDDNTNLGTDLFDGDIWQPGVIVTPEAYKTQFNFDGSAFPSCGALHQFQSNTFYYFQVQIYDLIGGKSEWATGFFKLNNPPTAANVRIIPAAPFHNQDLLAAYDFVDDPGEVEDTALTQIRWFQNGVEVVSVRNQKTVPADLLVPGDSWFFTVRPSDGLDFSLTAYPSAPVTILNRPPQVSALVIIPSSPLTNDDLNAVFATSDPDGDQVQVTIRWYKNGAEQPQLMNSLVVPASVTTVGDVWYFTVLPSDGFVNGMLQTSATVSVGNTPPRILSMSVDGDVLPIALDDPNPTISWVYQDDDSQPQQKFQVLIGSQPVRTTTFNPTVSRDLSASAGAGEALTCGNKDGIVSVAKSNGTIVAGNEIFDSGVIISGADSFQYLTADFIPPTVMNQVLLQSLNGYTIAPDLQSLVLRNGIDNGSASGKFPGQAAFYNVELTYIKESNKISTYKLVIDSATVGTFTSTPGTGTDKYIFPSVRIDAGASVSIFGSSGTRGAQAGFKQLKFTPITELDLNAGDFATLSGYLSDGTGGIKLAGLVGTASTPFTFPSGTYNVEFVYVTETNGSPSVSLSVAGSTVLSFNYEFGAATRSRTIQGVQINKGDIIKISGTRNFGAAARVKKIIFRPTLTVQVGAALKPGIKYFASTRVFDGMDWSDWATTAFVTSGFSWVSQVSNQTGWTIEFRMAVSPPATSGASGASGASGT